MSQKKNTILAILFSIIILIITWSLIEGWVPFARRKWIFMAIGTGVASFYPKANFFYKSKQFLWLIAYLLVLLVNMISGDRYFSNFGAVGFEFFALCFSAIVSSYALSSGDIRAIRIIVGTFLFVLVATAVMSFYIDAYILPNAIRRMTGYSITLKDMSIVYQFYKMGLSTYSFPHVLPVLIPPVIMGIKNKRLTKQEHLLCWILLGSLVLLIYLSGIMTSLLLAILAVSMAILTKEGDKRSTILRISIVGVLLIPFLSPMIMTSILHSAKEAVGDGSYYYSKLDAFESSLTGDDDMEQGGDWEERKDLYAKSVDGLTSGILIGTNQRVGGHSTLLDRFGVLGLVGIIPFIVFLIMHVSSSAKYMPFNCRIYYFEGFIIGLLMMTLKSVFKAEYCIVMLSILPLLTYRFSETNQQI